MTFVRYSGQHLCEAHFKDYVERRVKRELRRQLNLKRGGRIAVAISGGKDSSVALTLLSNILKKRPNVEMVAITVDEGISTYRPGGLESARFLCDRLDVQHRVVSYEKAFGWTMDSVVKVDNATVPCTYCGVFRRYLLNKEARELQVDYLSTGLNLDDTAQSVLMNIARGDMERMARLGPHMTVKENMIPRLQPLRLIPEKETYLYAFLKSIKFHEATCPYSARAARGLFREVLNRLENDIPGTRHSIVSSFDQMHPWLEREFSESKMNRCSDCGEPTMNVQCKACELRIRLNEKFT